MGNIKTGTVTNSIPGAEGPNTPYPNEIPPEGGEKEALPEHGGGSTGYLYHKLAKQALWRPLFATAFVPRSFQMYRTYLARYLQNPAEDIFSSDPMSFIFREDTKVGALLRRWGVPKELRGKELTNGDVDLLRSSGAKYISRAAKTFILANTCRLVGNLAGLADMAIERDGTTKEVLILGTDALVSASFIPTQHLYDKGSWYVQLARGYEEAGNAEMALDAQRKAYKYFRLGKIWSYTSFGLQALTAGIKLYNELEKGDGASLSAVVDAAVDVGQGVAYASYNYYLVSEARRVYSAATTAGDVINIKKAGDILSVSARAIPKPLLFTMRGLGLAGVAIGAVRSGMDLYEGITGSSLSDSEERRLTKEESRHKLISGAMGVAASIAFGAAAVLITPAALTAGTVAAGVGLAIVAAQTIYDEWDEIKGVAKKAWKKLTSWF